MPHCTALRLLTLAAALLLSACGGGSSEVPPTPIVAISFPTASTLTGATQITVVGVVPDPSLVMEVSVNGVVATTSDAFANWHVTVPLTFGSNAIRVSIVDGEGAFLADVAEATIENIGVSQDSIHALGRNGGTGELFLLDSGLDGLYATAPSAVVSDESRGTGDPVWNPQSVTFYSALDLAFVVNGGNQSILSIDLTSGDRTVLSDAANGSGTDFIDPRGSAIEINVMLGSRLFVTDRGAGADALIAVDLLTGDRTLFSGSTAGTGTDFDAVEHVVLDLAGARLFVTDAGLRAVFEVDFFTGDRTIISDDATGIGPFFDHPTGLAYDVAGNRLFVTDSAARVVFSVDLANGNRFVVSSDIVGSGQPLAQPNDVELDLASGRVLVADDGESVIAVDVASGDRTAIAAGAIGAGLPFPSGPSDVVQDPVGGVLFVAAGEGTSSAIYRVNLGNSSREIVASVSGGAPFLSVQAVALSAAPGRLNVLDRVGGAIYEVDRANGLTSVRSSDAEDTGPLLTGATDLELSADGRQAYCANPSEMEVLSVHLSTGDRTLLSGPSRGAGPDFVSPHAVALDEANNRIFVSDTGLNAILSVSASTGDRAILSDTGTGAGPDLATVESIVYDAENGRVLALDRSGKQLLAVDVGTGDRTVLQTSLDRGGPPMQRPVSMSAGAAAGQLFVVDARDADTAPLAGSVLLLETGVEAGLGTGRVTVTR